MLGTGEGGGHKILTPRSEATIGGPVGGGAKSMSGRFVEASNLYPFGNRNTVPQLSKP